MSYATLSRRTALATMLFLPLLMSAKEKKKTNDVSVFGAYRNLPANTAATEATRKQADATFPGWSISSDKLNGFFTDLNGAPIAVTGTTLSSKAAAIMDQKLIALGVLSEEWTLAKQYSAPKADYVNYKQKIAGHDVAFSSLSFRFTKAGALARVEMKSYGEPESGLAPKISAAKAKTAAIQGIEGFITSAITIDTKWSWFPIPHAGGYTLHPAWHFKAKGTVKGSVPQELSGYVDAITGGLLYRSNNVKETGFDVTINGNVYRDGTLHPATLEPLSDLWVSSTFGSTLTDSTGLASDITWLLPLSPTIPLEGQWSTVVDYSTGLTPVFSPAITVAGTTYTYPTTSPSSIRHVNAYYHVNRVHNFMKSYWPTFTDMDFSLPTNVDVTTGACNAYYNGASINFFAASATCNSFAEIGDIIYHEYGHGISDHFYSVYSSSSTMENGSLNEANSDVWAMAITHHPILGENSFIPNGGFIRRYDITPQVYPLDITTPYVYDPHYTGMIIAGCWWDVGVNLGSVPDMAQLFTDVYYDVPDGPDGTEGEIYHSILISTLLADDVDANISNGTPHYNQILSAFAKHGIYLEGASAITHTEVSNPAAGAPIPVSAVLSLEYSSYMNNLTVYYRLNGTGSWTAVPMTASGSTYTGTIPAQTAGTTVEYYFVMRDALGEDNGYFPITCNPNMPAYQTSLPYQFSVGLTPAITYNFEGAAPSWTIGLPSDDATDGRWIVGTPHLFLDLSAIDIDVNCFAPGDHTTGTGKCIMAGVGGTAVTNTSVSEGTTTVLSPIFDIANYTRPVFEYWRWFSSEFVISEIKNDPWITQIKDAASTSNPWITVERTYQSDQNWRHKVVNVNSIYLQPPKYRCGLLYRIQY